MRLKGQSKTIYQILPLTPQSPSRLTLVLRWMHLPRICLSELGSSNSAMEGDTRMSLRLANVAIVLGVVERPREVWAAGFPADSRNLATKLPHAKHGRAGRTVCLLASLPAWYDAHVLGDAVMTRFRDLIRTAILASGLLDFGSSLGTQGRCPSSRIWQQLAGQAINAPHTALRGLASCGYCRCKGRLSRNAR